MKRTIESLTPPADKQVMWLDISQEVKQLKAYINGEWVVVNDDTKNNEEIVNKVLEKIDNVLDIMSYGVSWKPNVADPKVTRVGNMSYHRTLPIQNNMRGCIAQMKDGVKIKYFLDPTDWRWREDPRGSVLKDQEIITVDVPSGIYKITNDIFSTLQYENQWIRLQGIVPCQVININTRINEATIQIEDGYNDGEFPNVGDVELGAVLNGYDGEVMVLVPEFWIKSWDTDTRREVRISPSKIDDTWEHQPRILISPYHDTVLNTVPENMGYLSTLEVGSAISVVNTNDYCRGGNNSADYDKYITSDPFRTLLGKARTVLSRAEIRASCRKSGKEMLSYLQYKRILYWLYVIEYANFNCQDDFDSELSPEGFKTGGLGPGVTLSPRYVTQTFIDAWEAYNNNGPLVPNGYTNTIGNSTYLIPIRIDIDTSYELDVPRWHGIENPFGDITCTVDGIIINVPGKIEGNRYGDYGEVYVTDDPSLYNDTDYSKMKLAGIEIRERGFIKEWDLGNTAEIIPRLIGGNTTKYKCDYNRTNRTGLIELQVGGSIADHLNAGLGFFYANYNINGASFDNNGFRSSCVVDKKSS